MDNVFCLIHSNFHLNLIVLSPLTVVNFLLHTTHSTHRNRPAELAVNTIAHSSAHTNLASPPLPQHWKFYNTSKDFSKVHFAVSVSLDFWNSMIPLNTPSFLKHFLKYHMFSQPLLPAIGVTVPPTLGPRQRLFSLCIFFLWSSHQTCSFKHHLNVISSKWWFPFISRSDLPSEFQLWV